MDVILTRAGLVESRHRVHMAVADPAGQLAAWAGAPDLITFIRSAAKPFQALPLVEEGVPEVLGLTEEELAVCCASHGGEPAHLERVRSLLTRGGFTEEDLECGPHPPLNREAARQLAAQGEPPSRIHNNCSGKHGGMLLLARRMGWDPRGYRFRDHPVQQRMMAEVARWTGIPTQRVRTGVDGCGVLCFALPLSALAGAFARFAHAASRDGSGPSVILEAMARHPFQVAGTGRLCTAVMEATDGRVVAKLGAEGVYAGVDRRSGLGFALKVEDGARRACEVALVGLLDRMEMLDGASGHGLAPWRERSVPNTLGEDAATLACVGSLESTGERHVL
ncbi:MAG: asparaginase [Gemmatimonadales bacterium]|nr:MAG: asparaginase [Gemmatimonadales bacterium]